MNYKDLGARIRDERVKFKLTQEKLAEIVGLSPIYIGQVERGERKMSLDTLVKIAGCLHVSIDYLITGSSESDNRIEVTELQALADRCTPEEVSMIADIVKVVLPHVRVKDTKK